MPGRCGGLNMAQDCLYIVIPAYNEQDTIENVAREWHDVVAKVGKDSRLVIINDGSGDRTGEILDKLSDELEQLTAITKPNSGHGGTVLYGYHYALKHNADYIFQTDSDGQTIPDEFWPFWEKRMEYEAVIGKRIHRGDGMNRTIVSKLLQMILLLIFGVYVTDANTPFRLMNKDILGTYIQNIPENYFLTNVMISVQFIYYKRKVLFLPITFQSRQGGRNSINIKRIIGIGWRSVGDFMHMRKVLRGLESKKCIL